MGHSTAHRVIVVGALVVCALLADQSAAVREAAEALQRGDFAAAEQKLRAEAAAHPDDAWPLSLLGYSLDNQKGPREAEEFHRRAVALAPRLAEILNNYGTHLWMAGEYDRAEAVFTDALAAAPTYFNVLYNLGVMAMNAGHYERAREVLESARRQQPSNVDVLYRLATVQELSRRWEDAAAHLAQAVRLDPKRADVQKLPAVTATELGALPDAAAGWDRYVALEPNDDDASRERGYVAVKLGKLEQGIAEIESYLARHPDDKVGHYELGQARRSLDPRRAIEDFDRALALDANYAAARLARGSLNYQDGKFEAALKDLEAAASLDAGDAGALDRLGRTYEELERPADAVRVLRRAAEVAPGDSKILLHLGRALADSGETEESKAVMDRVRRLGPEKKSVVPEGFLGYLILTPEERRRDYGGRLEKAVREHPDDAAAQLEYLKFVLENREVQTPATVARRILALKPAPDTLAEAGKVLLKADRFDLARDLLRAAAAGGAAVQLDLAIATFRAAPSTAAKAGLDLLDGVPEAQRFGDYDLVRAQMLDAAGKPLDAAAEIDKAVRTAPVRPELWLRGAALQSLPDNREILLMKAILLDSTGRSEDSVTLLQQIQRRWPEWPAVWAAQGIVLAARGRFADALPALEAAVALGGRGAEIDHFLAKSKAARANVTGDHPYLDRFYAGSLLLERP